MEVASRIQELEPTGPVLKAGPKAACTVEDVRVKVVARVERRVLREEGMVVSYVR